MNDGLEKQRKSPAVLPVGTDPVSVTRKEDRNHFDAPVIGLLGKVMQKKTC